MKSKIKRILSIVMTVSMLSTMVPLTTYGADFSDDGTGAQSTVEVPAQNDVSAEEPDLNDGSAQTSDISAGDQDALSSGDEDPFSTDEDDTFSAGDEVDTFSDDAASATSVSLDSLYTTNKKSAPVLDTKKLHKIVFLDCGRKYFSVKNIKDIIDNAAAAGFNYVELGIGNDGLRLLLDDMELTVDGTTYSSDEVKKAIHNGNKSYDAISHGKKKDCYYSPDTDELTQTEMESIISYANSKKLGVIPLLNTPGHMDAILSAATELTETRCSYNGSVRTIDVTNATAVAFTQALVQKYITYFAGAGCKFFNMGADEYANDKYDSGSMGFGNLQSSHKYSYYVKYVNKMADMIKGADMTPMAFNDGIYFNNDTNSGTFDKDIVICYWSNGWPGYTPMPAATLKSMGFNLINTHGAYYWVLGKSDTQCDAEKAKDFNYKVFYGSNTELDSLGGVFCIWCDYPGAGEPDSVVSATANTIAAFGATMASSNDTPTTPIPVPDVTPATETKPIKVPVNSTISDKIDGVNYSGMSPTIDDPLIATVEVTGTNGSAAKEEYTPVKVTASDLNPNSTDYTKTVYYYKSNGTYYELWAKYSQSIFGEYIYLAYGDNHQNRIGYYALYSQTNIDNIYTRSTTAAESASTIVTFTGVKIGKTTATVGNIVYNIEVVAEELSAVTPLTVEYWITNHLVTAGGATSKQIKAIDSTVNSEAGAKISDLVPATGTSDNNEMAYWKTTRLTSDNKQTNGPGVNRTTSGNDFSYIRYWNNKWSFSADGKNWDGNDFNSSDQIVAYYLQKTDVTDEVTTEVVDWGTVPYTNCTEENFVLVDYAVKYESGLLTPDSFPDSKKTQAFHCNYKDDKTSTGSDSVNYYRTIGMVRAEENKNFEVYMITLTPNSDTGTDAGRVAKSINKNLSYEYKGTEKVIWVDKEENLGKFSDSDTHYTGFKAGGEPIVDGLKIYNKHAMLVTYYIRAKKTKSSLSVHYIDKTTGDEFYSYNIAVDEGTKFNKDIALDSDNPKGYLKNGEVKNIEGKIEKVSSNLSDMPKISAQYKNSGYTCDGVERVDDKTVNLYYTFNNTHSFVIDYGRPLVITADALNISSGDWLSSSVEGAEFGEVNLGDKKLTYTPTSILTKAERLQLTLVSEETDKDGNKHKTEVPHYIYIYPATTVYYEERFASYDKGVFKGGNSEEVAQEREFLKEHTGTYGHDIAYENDSVASNNSAATADKYGATATFNFKGTGVDIYLNCTKYTSPVLVRIENKKTKELEKIYIVDTKISGGETEATTDQNKLENSYNTPVVSAIGATALSDQSIEHKVEIIQLNSSTEKSDGISIDGFRVYNTLDSSSEYPSEEQNPQYAELRNKVLGSVNQPSSEETANDVAKKVNNQVYASDEAGNDIAAVLLAKSDRYKDANLQDLLKNGPKNEIYVYPKESIVFKLEQRAQIGLKGVNGKATCTIGTKNPLTKQIPTTDMFYELSKGEITIRNTGTTVLSITKIKYFESTKKLFGKISEEALTAALLSMGYPAESVSTDTPTPTQKPENPVKLSTPKLGKVVSESYNSVKVTWSKVKNADGYRVYMKENGKWKYIARVTSNSYTRKGLETGKEYTFTVRAYKKTSNGLVLSAFDKKGISGTPVLSAPTLKSAKRSSAGVTFKWDKTAGANGYVVYRKTNNGRWVVVAKVKGTTYKDTKAKKGVKYTYSARAYRKSSAGTVYSTYNEKGLSVK